MANEGKKLIIEQCKYHPIIKELGLEQEIKSKQSPKSVTAIDILNRLLVTNVLRPQLIRSAFDEILGIRSRQTKNTLEIEKTTNKKPSNEDVLRQQKERKETTSHRLRHIALRFYYDGAGYTGLAQNIGQENDNSVEKALFQALQKAKLVESRETCGYSRCGRTDRGVSAAGQVIAMHLKSMIPMDASWDAEGNSTIQNDNLPKNSFDTINAWVIPRRNKKKHQNGSACATTVSYTRQQKELTEYPYAKILNNLLPADIRILGWSPVSMDFSARFSATNRTYRYFFHLGQMNKQRLNEGLDLLVGKHDFRNFCKMDVEKVYNFERLIHSAELVEMSSGVYYFQIVGQAFLWHQIRCIVSILFLVGRGLESPSVITDLLDIDRNPGKPSYQLASEFPLVLHDCGYPNLQFGHSVQNLWTLSCQLEKQWEELTLAAARLRNCLSILRKVKILKADLTKFATSKTNERQKKRQRYGLHKDITMDVKFSASEDDSVNTMVWEHALPWLKQYDLVPTSSALDTAIHIPLLKRSRGTTYEEKVGALQKSERRRKKYEENVIKKRKTTEEDSAFYDHMTKQGGRGI